jgi:hypothetical protein
MLARILSLLSLSLSAALPPAAEWSWTWRHNLYSSKLPTYPGAWGLDVIQTLDVTIENNTFAGINWCGVGLRGKESSNGRIRKNLFYDMQQAVLDGTKDDFTAANPVVEYNLAFKIAPLAMDTNLNGKDPLLVDAEKRDFRLRKGSPAIGAGKGGVTICALEYPNVYYVDPRHPAAADEPAWGYPGVPLATLAKACAIARPGETIVLRGGVYREVLAPANDGVTIRAMKGEKVIISGRKDTKIEGITVVDTLKARADVVKGTATDSTSSRAIANVLVQEAGTGNVTLTDAHGRFTLEINAAIGCWHVNNVFCQSWMKVSADTPLLFAAL